MITIHNLGQHNSLINQFVSELRNVEVQHDRMRFRRNLERIGEIISYEISKMMPYHEVEITTPLGTASMQLPSEQPVLATILRAGLPLHQGFLNYFDQADNSFISAYRKHHKDGSFEIALEYVSSASLENRVMILCDPMLATGSSIVMTYKAMMEKGVPRHTHIVCAIASLQGIEHVKSHLSENVTVWAAAIDDELTAQSYIVPGLGDAGDLAFGEKL